MKKLQFLLLLFVCLLPVVVSRAQTKVVTVTSLPATCNAGGATIPADEIALVSGGSTKLYICSSTNTWSPVGGASTFDQIGSGTNTTATHGEGTGAVLEPVNLGQVAASQGWMPAGVTTPTVTTNANSGSILGSHSIQVQVTYVTASGQTLPSLLVAGGTASCGTGCNVVVTAPTLASGYTGYDVYSCDINAGGPCTAPQLLAGCTNITTNCTISSSPTANTSGVPTVTTAWPQPVNVQAGNVPDGSIPYLFFPKTDGNYYPWLTVNWLDCDNSTGPPCPAGTPLFTHRTFFSDLGGPSTAYPNQTQAFKNAFISVNHGAGIGTVITNQDRALAILMQNGVGDSSAHYSMAAIQAETDLNGAMSLNGSPDGEGAAGSFQLSDSHTGTNTSTGTFGIHAVRAHTFIQSGAGNWASCAATPCVSGVEAFVQDNTTSGGGSNAVAAFYGRAYNANGTATSRIGFGAYIQKPGSTGRFASGNYGYYVENYGTNTVDWNIWSDSTNGTPTSGRNWLGGNVYLPNILTAANTISVTGSESVTGSVGASQLATPTAPTVSVVGGGSGTTYTYGFVGKDGNGNSTPISSTSNGSNAATLDGTHSNNVCLGGANTNVTNGYSSIDVYRTVSGGTPPTTGKIGTITVTNTSLGGSSWCLSDTSLAGDGTTAPTINSTGSVKAASAVQSTAKTFANLPACTSSLEGAMQAVTDSSTATWGATITGSSTNHVLAYCDGTNWTVAAK